MRDTKNRFAGRAVWNAFGGIALALALWAGGAQAEEPEVVPMPGRPTFVLGSYDITALGYTMNEFSVAGTAMSYKSAGEVGSDGQWNVTPAGTAPYATRIVVLRPSDPRKFNGTVVVEWMNVSGGLDVPVDWMTTHRELARGGYAYVGVSAQKVGIEGGGFSLGPGTSPLKVADPARYGKLAHPGDAFSYDIFSQVGRLLRSGQAAEILGHLTAERIIAIGESQSAAYLATYVDAVDPLAKVYDGIVIHSRASGAAPLDGTSFIGALANSFRQIVKLRSDLRVPVMQLITETDLLGFGLGGFYGARQPDTDRLRTWEIAGTAHADNYLFSVGAIDSGSVPIEQLAAAWAPMRKIQSGQLDKPINNAPQHHYVTEAAVCQLDRWLRTGEAPPKAAPLEVIAGNAPKLALDANGNAQGGIRSPWVDVPTSRLSGSGNTGSMQAMILGTTEPFDKATLDRLYPGGKREYLERFEASLSSAIKAGFILAADKQEIMDLARISYQDSN